MSTHEINKERHPKYGFWTITCPEGDMITSWNEGDDIRDFNAFTIAYCPEAADLSVYHCITKEEAEAKEAERNAILKKEHEEKINNKD